MEDIKKNASKQVKVRGSLRSFCFTVVVVVVVVFVQLLEFEV
jgi:hypothetical protein